MCITEYDEDRAFAEQLEDGIEKGRLDTLIDLVKDGILTLTDAAKRAGMTVTEFEEATSELKA